MCTIIASRFLEDRTVLYVVARVFFQEKWSYHFLKVVIGNGMAKHWVQNWKTLFFFLLLSEGNLYPAFQFRIYYYFFFFWLSKKYFIPEVIVGIIKSSDFKKVNRRHILTQRHTGTKLISHHLGKLYCCLRIQRRPNDYNRKCNCYVLSTHLYCYME